MLLRGWHRPQAVGRAMINAAVRCLWSAYPLGHGDVAEQDGCRLQGRADQAKGRKPHNAL